MVPTWMSLAGLTLITSLPLLILPDLPGILFITTMVIVGLILIRIKSIYFRWLGYGFLLFTWHAGTAVSLVNDINQLSEKPLWADIQIEKYHPDSLAIQARLLLVNGQRLFPPRYAQLYLTQGNGMETFCVGQHWKTRLKLKPVHARLNLGEFDRQRFMLANHIPFQGKIISANIINAQCSWRDSFIQGQEKILNQLAWQGILRALAFGERSTLSKSQRDLLRETGTGHLMAISGMHIGLAAILGYWLARIMQVFLPSPLIGYRWPLVASIIVAGVYTFISGANLPAQRAMLALLLWTMLRLNSRNLSGIEIWLLCIGLLLLFDPLTVLSDSFWLSALAVLMLLIWYHIWPLPSYTRRWYWMPLHILHLQAGMMLLMLPLQATLFEGISLSAIIANLFAIPVISLITVPLILLALILPVTPVKQLLWQLADKSVGLVFTGLQKLPPGWIAIQDAVWWALAIWGGLLLIYFAGLRPLLLACCTLILTIILWRQVKPKSDWQITMLDVGHGLAVVITKQNKALLYDTGNRWQISNAGERVIVPWLQRHHFELTEVILSHAHQDHIGGLPGVIKAFPQVQVRSALGKTEHIPCERGQRWVWQGLRFAVLWPLAGEYRGDNNGSCVIRVDDGDVSLLLTGDLEHESERQLVKLESTALQTTILQVPHHGSRTSSTPLFLRTVQGSIALASVARYNAWRLPSAAVIQAYQQAGYHWYSTARSGQIQITVSAGKWSIAGLREQILPRWYHQWFGVYP